MKIPSLVAIDPDFWIGRRVLVTGHTGFKGAWLCLWLQSLGAEVTGLARMAPGGPSIYDLAGVGEHMSERAVDVRDEEAVLAGLHAYRPEVVIHLAAQPMVRRSLRDPLATYEVNVMGTVNVLDAVRRGGPGVRAVLVVGSDKCYENPGAGTRPFVESDPLGGGDPYSSSKGCAELVTAAYRRSYFHGEDAPRVASARAGNVIGGGDWGEDRLLADAARAVQTGEAMRVRNPDSVRPWQHVLAPLEGYLRLVQLLYRDAQAARAWNFGPPVEDSHTVKWILDQLAGMWEGRLSWEVDNGPHPPEVASLLLDSSMAARELGWRQVWDLRQALAEVVAWHRAQLAGAAMREVSLAQIARFQAAGGAR